MVCLFSRGKSEMIEVDTYYWVLARVFVAIVCAFAALGIFSNFILLITTIKSKNLRSMCNILIAICAAGDILHQCGTLFPLPFIFGFYIEIDSDLCSYIMFIPEMGIAVGCTCIFCVGLDRMFAVLIPFGYKSLYKGLIASFIIASCVYLTFLMLYFYKERPIFCEILRPYHDGLKIFAWSTLAINMASAVVYMITWLCLLSKPDTILMRRIMKSLFIIVIVDVCGWLLTPGLFTFFKFIGFNAQQLFAWTFFCKIFVNFALSIKMYIYYCTRASPAMSFPANAVSASSTHTDLETHPHHHRFAQSRMEYPMQDIPETPRTHNKRGSTRTPLRLAAELQNANSPIITPSPEDVKMACAHAQQSVTTSRDAQLRLIHPIAPPSTDIHSSWARAQAQEPWYQNVPLGSPPMAGSLHHIVPAQNPAADPATVSQGTPPPTCNNGWLSHDHSYSTPHRPSNAYNAPPPSAIPIPYEWCSPEAAALPLPPPGFENSTIGSASSSPRQSLRSYRSRADSEGSHYDSALSSHSPCSAHRDDGSLRLSISDGEVDPSLGPSSPAFSTTSSLYTAASCMYCLPSDDNAGFVMPAAPQTEYDEDGFLLRPKEPSSPGFSYPSSRSSSNSSSQGLFCSSDNDGSIEDPEPVNGSVPHHAPGPIQRPRSVEDQTSVFLKRRQERLLRANDDCLEEEKLESMRFLVEAELLI
ncbi:hypothetical protein PRIPAC_91768 [Pristionchus pacificus]|uniref:G protein-coupled receptor n=1 Tax=Pristionchus pacificus TaxID=54126 RepID=A0A2A6CDT3_PRIPA|nr:hypothetical protein PRIPAC_91768 [Pristionchus pacificus]|eukprot:PDM76267.1 G protein-coupled receptor [Pristionchus pacificus]